MPNLSIQRTARFVLYCLFCALPLIFTTTNEELFEFPKMLLVYGSAVLLLGCFAIESVQARKISLPRTPFDLPILFFLASQMLSTLFSIDMHTSLFGYYSRFNGGLFSVFSYLILFYAVVHFVGKEQIRSLLKSIFVGAILATLYAFPEHFGASPSCLLIMGKFTDSCWIQDVQSRVFGTLGQPNWLAAYIVVALPLVISKILSVILEPTRNAVKQSISGIQSSQRRSWIPYPPGNTQDARDDMRRYLFVGVWILEFLLFSTVLFFTKSRSGILGAGVALALQLGLLGLISYKKKQVKSLWPVICSLFTFIVLLLVISNPVKDKLLNVLHLDQTIAQTQQTAPSGTQLENGGSESGDIRKVVWTGAIKVWLRYPILGSGVETFAYSYYRDRPQRHNLLSEWDFLYNKAHNEFLNYLATTGAVGFLAYITMYGSFVVFPIVWAYREKTKHPLSTIYYLLSTSASLAGLAVSNFFGFSTVVVSTFTFVLPAMALVIAQKQTSIVFDLPIFVSKKWPQRSILGIVSLATIYVLLSTLRLYSIDAEYANGKNLIRQNDVTEGVALLQDAVNRSPSEPVYRDELAYTAARLAYALSETGDSTRSADLAQAAIDHSDIVLSQNSVNVNFYKTRVRIFSLLAHISPVFYDEANTTLAQARILSPTDPKLTYNQALIAHAQGKTDLYEKYLKETIALRPIDIQAQIDLAELYMSESATASARETYEHILQIDPKNHIAIDGIASISAKIQK